MYVYVIIFSLISLELECYKSRFLFYLRNKMQRVFLPSFRQICKKHVYSRVLHTPYANSTCEFITWNKTA